MGKKAKLDVNGEKKAKKEPRRKTEKPSRGGYFVKRGLAFIVDWYISTVLINFAIGITSGFFSEGITIVESFADYTLGQTFIMVLVVFLVSLFYYVYVPLKVWRGQTLMLHVLQLKVMSIDGQELDLKHTLLRFCVGCLILEGAFYSCTTISIDALITKFFVENADLVYTLIGGPLMIASIVSLFTCFLDKEHSRLFHDRLAKSEVIDLYAGGQGAL